MSAPRGARPASERRGLLRPYRPADVEDLLAAWEAASRIAHPFLDEAFLTAEREAIRDEYLPVAETWIWELERRARGFLSLVGNEIGGLFVHPDYQRGGAGRALLAKAIERRGSLEVEVFEENRIGRAFYDRCGFTRVERKLHPETGRAILRLRLDPGA